MLEYHDYRQYTSIIDNQQEQTESRGQIRGRALAGKMGQLKTGLSVPDQKHF
jgi:hypothetical protein